MSRILRPYIIENAFGLHYVKKYSQNSCFMVDLLDELYLKDRNIKSVLSLCCGFGHVERQLVDRLDSIKECLGLDLSEGALKIARQRSNKIGMRYEQADLNNYKWETKKYDLVIANGALHHISNLEDALSGIYQTLKPGGIFFACEYVGPSYMNHQARQLELINAAAFLVPPELRARSGRKIVNEKLFQSLSRLQVATYMREQSKWPKWQKLVARYSRPLFHRNEDNFDFGPIHISMKKYLLNTDPSECVRSEEIIPYAQKIFKKLEVRPLGGGILQHALDARFYENYDETNLKHISALEALCQLERSYMKTGEIGLENAFLIAQRPI